MTNNEIFRPLDPAFVMDPYPIYELLRTQDPVHQTSSGVWVLTRYDDVVAGLRDIRLSNRPAAFALVNSRNSERYLAAKVANGLIAFLDQPDHSRPRSLIAKACQAHFKGKDKTVRDVADDLLAQLRGKPEIELTGDFSIPFAVGCISRLMGLPDSDANILKYWSGMFFYLFHSIPNQTVLAEVNKALSEFRHYVRVHVEMRKKKPRDDLLSNLLSLGSGEDALSEQELIDNVMLLVADGIENVQAGLSTAVYTLLNNPDQLQRVITDRTLINPAIQECLRYESPGQYQGRVALEPIEIRGKTIKAHSIVLLALASANRDPAAFLDPDRFLVDRTGPNHVAFGLGRHACIGRMLIGMEFSAALGSLFDGSRSLAPSRQSVDWTSRAGHRWPASLMLTSREIDPA